MAITGFGRSITWNDFTPRTARPAGEEEDANTSATFPSSFAINWDRDADAYSLKQIVVTLSMSRSKSWVVTSAKASALLSHEQGHFDITGLGARDLNRQLKDITGTSVDDARSQARDLIAAIQAKVDQKNIDYDEDTTHGSDASAQARWTAAIRAAVANPDGSVDDVP